MNTRVFSTESAGSNLKHCRAHVTAILLFLIAFASTVSCTKVATPPSPEFRPNAALSLLMGTIKGYDQSENTNTALGFKELVLDKIPDRAMAKTPDWLVRADPEYRIPINPDGTFSGTVAPGYYTIRVIFHSTPRSGIIFVGPSLTDRGLIFLWDPHRLLIEVPPSSCVCTGELVVHETEKLVKTWMYDHSESISVSRRRTIEKTYYRLMDVKIWFATIELSMGDSCASQQAVPACPSVSVALWEKVEIQKEAQ